MEFFKSNLKINFLRLRKWTGCLSIVLFLISISALFTQGLNWGLDFTGGTQVVLKFPAAADLTQLRETLTNNHIKNFELESYGSNQTILLTLGLNQNSNNNQKISVLLNQIFKNSTIESMQSIGAKVSHELAIQGIIAIFIALILTSFYITFRFEYRMAIGSAVALIHDPVMILGVFSLFHLEFNLTALAALLTVIGYSLNDTIVVFDRIRENFVKLPKSSTIEIVNSAINQTLSRTVMTSALTLTVVLALLCLGGPVVRSFSIALVIGIIVGTYSSIYVAGTLAVMLGLHRRSLVTKN